LGAKEIGVNRAGTELSSENDGAGKPVRVGNARGPKLAKKELNGNGLQKGSGVLPLLNRACEVNQVLHIWTERKRGGAYRTSSTSSCFRGESSESWAFFARQRESIWIKAGLASPRDISKKEKKVEAVASPGSERRSKRLRPENS